MNIADILKESAVKLQNKTAIIDIKNTSRISFDFLEKNSSKIANMFRESGLSEGDGVLLMIPMSVELYTVLTAVFKMKLVAVFIDPYADSNHIKECCRMYPPKALIISGKKAGLFTYMNSEVRKIPNKFILNGKMPGFKKFSEYEDCSFNFAPLETESETKALITFTSGSTGKPKALVRTHGFLSAQQEVLEKSLEIPKNSKILVAFPIFLLSNIYSGLTSIISDIDLKKIGETDGGHLAGQIMAESIDTIMAPPSFFDDLIMIYKRTGRSIHSIKRVITGGVPVFPEIMQNLKKIFPYAEIKVVYGSSEAEPMSELCHSELDQSDIEKMKNGMGLLAGKIVEGIELKIIENNQGELSGDDARILEQGERGEIIVSGEHVLKTYLNSADDKKIKLKINNKIWHRTGDLGYVDTAGRLWLLGRAKAEITLGNEKIYPFSVETMLSFEKDIKRTAIIQKNGKILLFIEIYTTDDEEEKLHIQEKLKNRLKELEIRTDKVIFTDKIPVDKRHNGKIDYRSLEKLSEKYN
jgi:acyl-CoA synthetase (AMP-forming)/AMP-acid ligase II